MYCSPEYAALNQQLHADRPDYGNQGHENRHVVRFLSSWGREAVLDFGAGKGTLKRSLGPAYRVTNYDPAVPDWSAWPEPHEVVACLDVLEHVEPEHLEGLLKALYGLTKKYIVATVHTGPAIKNLPDGRNTHLTQQKPQWWVDQFKKAGFYIITVQVGEDHVAVQARPQ